SLNVLRGIRRTGEHGSKQLAIAKVGDHTGYDARQYTDAGKGGLERTTRHHRRPPGIERRRECRGAEREEDRKQDQNGPAASPSSDDLILLHLTYEIVLTWPVDPRTRRAEYKALRHSRQRGFADTIANKSRPENHGCLPRGPSGRQLHVIFDLVDCAPAPVH